MRKRKFRGVWSRGAFPLLKVADDKKSNSFIVSDTVVYSTRRFGYQRAIYVNPPFKTDLASIPRVMPLFLHRNTLAGPAVIHDYLYRCKSFHGKTRKRCDQVFLDAMIDNGVSRFLAYTYYSAVRTFGSFSYADA